MHKENENVMGAIFISSSYHFQYVLPVQIFIIDIHLNPSPHIAWHLLILQTDRKWLLEYYLCENKIVSETRMHTIQTPQAIP